MGSDFTPGVSTCRQLFHHPSLNLIIEVEYLFRERRHRNAVKSNRLDRLHIHSGTLGPVGSTNLFIPISDTESSSCLSAGLATAGDDPLQSFMGHLFCDR